VVAILSGWHEHHEVALQAARQVNQLPAHVLVEAASVLTRLPGGQAGLGGGAVYDGLIAATAHHHGARLLTLDQRALSTYRAIGAQFTQLID